MDNLKQFEGVWVLDASKNQYETSNAPKTGQYTITRIDEKKLEFHMQWTDLQDKSFAASYFSIVDGVKYVYENPEIAELIETKMIAENVMQTSTYKNGKVISRGTRELSNDGQSMIVVQEVLLPSGEMAVNQSIYHKQ